MLLLLTAALALQVQVNIGVGDRCFVHSRVGRDSARTAADSACTRRPRRIPVTPQHLASAFRDPGAKTLLMNARASRLRQDSAIVSYEANAYQRISAGLGFARIGRDRLIFRTENASHVRWHRDVGAWVEVKGARTVVPIAPGEGEKEARDDLEDELDDMTPLPYYPGYEPLWIGTGLAKTEVDERQLVHPLAEGSEAYYTYQSGDTTSLRLPDGRVIRIRELRVRPRATRWNLAVGSLWFDADRGQLVRAIYRLAEPIDVWAEVKRHDPKDAEDVPKWVMPLISPLRAQVNAIAVEYGLHQGQFWLPRMQSAEGEARVSAFRVPFKMEQSFRYTSVNAIDSLRRFAVGGSTRLDSLWRSLDTLAGPARERLRDSLRAARRASRDSVRGGLKRITSQCDTSDFRIVTRYRFGGAQVPVAVKIPCDRQKLASSPELPRSIYDAGEELFGVKERESLIAEALSLTAQPAFGPQRPVVRYGLQLMRFNRVEGLSVGAAVEQQFGAGYSARGVGRIGFADLEPNVELSLARSNLLRTIRVTGYNRLVAANDWGDPLSFGSSLGALLWGRDEGFYYRTSGAEFAGSGDRGVHFDWRFFAEQQRAATLETQFSLANAVGNTTFEPNIEATRGTYVGSAVRLGHSYGLDPAGFRMLSDLRLEAAGSDAMYGRAALDLTLSHGLGRVVGTPLAGSVTLGVGSTAGEVPVQRLWYLGGTQTVRGQRAGAAVGDAYWLARAELGLGIPAARPVLFADWGWADDRDAFREVGRPLSGVGIGGSFVDGMIRFDVARGVYPEKRWSVNLYVEARF
ncbi:MAG: outer membrane protein assembly factor [Gemmatimonadota bacterium]|nr:outer membrane protein assembly factor [Gemmatimonadota bacterium]